MKTKLHILGCAGIPARYGGFETFAEEISKILINNHDIRVYCDRNYYNRNERSEKWNHVNRTFLRVPANGMLSVLYDLISLIKSVSAADYILILGIGAGLFLPFFNHFKRVKFITHLDGAEWIRPKWNYFTRKYLRLSADLSIRYSRYIIVDNKALFEFIPAKFQNKIVYMGYGGDHLPAVPRRLSVHDKDFALMVCRAEPENNLELVIRAFFQIKHIDLIIISNWRKTRYGRKLEKTYRNMTNIVFRDPIYDNPLLLQNFRENCKFYLHGHSAGGTNPSLVEAMFTGCPVLAYNNVYNRNTTKNLASYFKSATELVTLINTITPAELLESSKKMQKYAITNYGWKKVAQALQSIL